MGTIKASSLQPYRSAVNTFFKDHGREPMALGDLVGMVRKGLAASQVTLYPELMRAPLPARVVLRALAMANDLRLELGLNWGTGPGTVVRVKLLFRASPAVVPPPRQAGFAWTSHSLRKGGTTAAYVIGMMMQKIQYFGGWAMESSVVLDYIDQQCCRVRQHGTSLAG
eukprot:jgi/Tetstr1/429557/TSEL_019457.t1